MHIRKKTIRLIETTVMKLINAKLVLLSKETCKNESNLTRYNDIYIYNYIYVMYIGSRYTAPRKIPHPHVFL